MGRTGVAFKLGVVALAVASASAFAQDEAGAPGVPGVTAGEVADLGLLANNLWILIAAAMVFVMHLGFSCLETGLTRAKNTVNILFKNMMIIAIGLLTYALIGFNLMYPDGNWIIEGWLPAFVPGIGMSDDYDSVGYADGSYTYYADFIFQAMFAATAATIVSGAVAERIKLGSFLIFSAIYVAIVYPIYGSWKWGGGWLDDAGFHDFAGSTIVHSVGGWGALAGVIVLGPRLGKYLKREDGKTVISPIMGHSMPLAAIGVFLLWFGWFGFNGGSVLSADPESVSFVFVTTALAAAAGIVTAMITSQIAQRKPDLTMVLNGCLAGLVGITAGADVISPTGSIIVGGVAGVIVVFSVIGLDRLKLDDPVGAISVHLVCGIWGTLAVAFFAEGKSLVAQLQGIAAAAVLCFPVALLLFAALRFTLGLRVSRAEELAGLDQAEHAMESYAGFQIFSNQ
ncbi:MAG: ammonium transporter [Planctomycetota bacterium]